jgi:hypothetical protein
LGSVDQKAGLAVRPARLAILVAGSAGLGSIAAIGSRLIDHRCVTTT